MTSLHSPLQGLYKIHTRRVYDIYLAIRYVIGRIAFAEPKGLAYRGCHIL